MNSQAQFHRVEAGQALVLPRSSAGPAVLTDGELLMQEPARWLAGLLVLPTPVRLVAPAMLPLGQSHSFVAVRPSSVIFDEPAPLLSRERVRAVATWIRGFLERGRPLVRHGRVVPAARD
jgi:hypothetical protein